MAKKWRYRLVSVFGTPHLRVVDDVARVAWLVVSTEDCYFRGLFDLPCRSPDDPGHCSCKVA